MLSFIIGTAGTGKTACLTGQIEEWVRGGGEAILLVPEQLSFESEKKLHRLLGPKLSLQVQALSFTRLCNAVFRQLGGLASAPATPAAKLMMMSVAVEELRDRLVVYRKSSANTAFLGTLLETCGEFKTAGISPERLLEFSGSCDKQLGDKLREMGEIYSAYQALLDQGYSDGDDDLIRACELLENHNFFGGRRVYVDGFTTFMAGEFELLGHAIAQAERVTLALTCDELCDRQKGMGVFSPVKRAAARLIRLAERGGVPVEEPTLLKESLRFRTEPLRFLGEQFHRPGLTRYPETGPPEGIRIFAAPDRYREMEGVAASISRLVREEGFRYREIAVVARETGPYLRAMQMVFSRYEIPYFCDDSQPVENHPLVAGLLTAVNGVRGNYDTESILLLAKNPILGIPAEQAAALDNYCYCWGIRGAAWTEPFSANPRGLAGPPTEADLAALEEINGVRAQLVDPLTQLREALWTESGRGFGAGLFHFLEQVAAAEHLTAYGETLDGDEQSEFFKDSVLVWDTLMGVLDVFGEVLGSVKLPRSRLCDLLRLALATAETGLPPQTLDQTLVGKADRIRPVDLRAVFVIGAVEGEFPAQAGAYGVFSDEERRRMIEAGVEVAAPTLDRAVLENFFAYYALTLGSDVLFVSYPTADLTGAERIPSALAERLTAMFPGLEAAPLPESDYLAGRKAALAVFSGEVGAGSKLEQSLLTYLSEGERRETLARMKAAREKQPHRLSRADLSKELFGNRMRLSPTRVERYYRCPFSYFAADGLRIRPRQKVEFSPLESGSVIHTALQVMVQRHGGKGLLDLPEEQLEREIRAIIQGYLEERVERMDQLPARFQHLFARLAGTLLRLLRRIGEEFAQSEFQPVEVELPISLDKGVEPLRLVTPDGVSVMVEGVVDRVDVMEKNGVRYVRVVDYKSGAKSFALQDILYGLNMQMLLYLFTIAEHGTGGLADAVPAGVLYMPVRESFISAERDDSDEAVAAQRKKQWKMSGLLLDDEEVLRGMERDVAGVFIPAKLGKNGRPDARSSLAGLAEMGKLSDKVKELIAGMASALRDGGIQAIPVQGGDYHTCDYCDYRGVCGIEPGDPVVEIGSLDREAALKMLMEEDDHE